MVSKRASIPAERILNDPGFLFDQAAIEKAQWENVCKLWHADKKRAREEEVKARSQRAEVRGQKPAIRNRKSWNRPRQVPAIEVYQVMLARQAYLRASQPMLYVGPVVGPRR